MARKTGKHAQKKLPQARSVLPIVVLLILLGSLVYFAYTKNALTAEKAGHASSAHDKNSSAYKAHTFTPAELHDLDKEKYIIIDVRTKLEYDKGHIPGAVHADYYDTEALKKVVGNKIPITYCTHSIWRGPYAAYQLNQLGYKNVSFVEGGVSAYAEDLKNLNSNDPLVNTVFSHPKARDLFPVREKGTYPANMGTIEFNMIAKQFSFEPSIIEVKHGQTVTLNIKSEDVVHGIVIPEFGVEVELPPNQQKSVTFVADRKGVFPFICNVLCGADHDHASMIGRIIVK